MHQKLDKKLTEWADAKEYFTDEDGCPHRKVIQFTQSLDACFRWLVPKLRQQDINLRIEFQGLAVDIKGSNPRDDDFPTLQKSFAYADTPALALCLAIEKIIDRGEKCK